MKIGCGVQQFSQIATAKSIGFDYVELSGRKISAQSEAEFAQLRSELEKCQIPCLCINSYCPPEIIMAGPGYNREAAQVYARKMATRAKPLGVCKVVIGSPASRILPDDFDIQLAREQLLLFTADTAEIFNQYNIQIGLEALGNCFCNFINRTDEAVSLIAELDRYRVGLVLDFYNMEKSNEAGRELKSLVTHVMHTHLSDDLGTPLRRSFLLPERYAIHEERIFRLLNAGYDDTFSLEVDIPIDETAAESLGFLRKTLDSALKQLG